MQLQFLLNNPVSRTTLSPNTHSHLFPINAGRASGSGGIHLPAAANNRQMLLYTAGCNQIRPGRQKLMFSLSLPNTDSMCLTWNGWGVQPLVYWCDSFWIQLRWCNGMNKWTVRGGLFSSNEIVLRIKWHGLFWGKTRSYHSFFKLILSIFIRLAFALKQYFRNVIFTLQGLRLPGVT